MRKFIAALFVAALLTATAAQAQHVKTFKAPKPGPTSYSHVVQ